MPGPAIPFSDCANRSRTPGDPAGVRPATARSGEPGLRHIQQREDHWAIIDLKGKAGHTRTVPLRGWVKAAIDEWLQAANLSAGKARTESHPYLRCEACAGFAVS